MVYSKVTMAKKNKYKKLPPSEAVNRKQEIAPAWHSDIHPDTKKIVFSITAFVIASLLALSYIGKGGVVGNNLYRILNYLLGTGYFFAPLVSILIGFSILFSEKKKILLATFLGGLLFLLASLSGMRILFGESTGGVLGNLLGSSFLTLFDFWASLIIVTALFIISLLFMINLPLWRRGEEDSDAEEEKKETATKEESPLLSEVSSLVEKAIANIKKTEPTVLASSPATPPASASENSKDDASLAIRKVAKKYDYKKPPLDLLQGDRGTPSSGDIRANANIIKRTLENFGIDVEMGEVSVGPTVTQYTLKPAEGVKLSRITALGNDLSLALAAHPLRIEAPIPGKSLVGIEVPNRSIALVGLRALFEHKIYTESSVPLLFALGRDVAGAPIFADLAKMPHLLISGATGTGKSVSAHSIITSFLYRNPPEVLRFIIVDPKRVELSMYNDIPHLLTPVITDHKKAIQSLRWATKEMDRRYDALSANGSRDIANYNIDMLKKEEEILPYIVIMIDELADLMSMFPREMEASVVRLAQMARAVGIHLIVATQRPSVEVITGLIKANITSRIAFQVASQIDSRTVLDMAGAEKLLGNGDMLFMAGDTSKPRRIQGAFVSEQEVKKVVSFLREEAEAPEYDEAILAAKTGEEGSWDGNDIDEGSDPLYDEARGLVIQAGKASASYLQRRLRVGYARAARLLDILESNGVIGPGDGAKPREVLIKEGEAEGVEI